MSHSPFFTSALVLDSQHSIRFQAELNLHDAETPPNLCLFGRNGVGKTRILRLLQLHLENPNQFSQEASGTIVITLHEGSEEAFFVLSEGGADPTSARVFQCSEPLREAYQAALRQEAATGEVLSQIREEGLAMAPAPKLLNVIFEREQAASSGEQVWEECLQEIQIDYQSKLQNYLQDEANQQDTVADALQQFEERYPSPLKTLATLWNHLLAPSDLSLCTESGGILRLSKQETIPFSKIPGALQAALLNSAIICLEIARCEESPLLLLLDDPETGLYPDLAEGYLTLLGSLAERNPFQLVTTTKSPNIAALFPSNRRIRIALNDDGFQSAQGDSIDQAANGSVFDKAPDPKETEVDKKPLSRKARYAKLKKAIDETDDQEELANLVDELMSLRNL